ncbi:ABC transporter permease [Neptunicoccus cionae]|uniref:ABC transporter permease n=1 Tax=Neptunicoccus cionae TaxID=2035344 RepID=UPI000C770FA6|nr:ABC transporter permease [Amylibacter cionae]PLS21736.1 sugar ABC transporter permease [Amylibacter cionae]
MLRLEARPEPSRAMVMLTPIIAVIATMIAGGILFAFLGNNPFTAIRIIFWDPLFNDMVASYTRPQLLVKAAPLILMAIGLSFGFRANVWNIGAEGQFIMGAVIGGGTALALYPLESPLVFPLIIIMGGLGGFLWAMIPAILKIRFNANEILVSLMLVYVAAQFLAAMVTGPMKSPVGMGFPVSRNFNEYQSAFNAELLSNTGLHFGVLVMMAVVIVGYIFLTRHIFGFQIRVSGQSARASKFAGVNPHTTVALCLGISGALAGLAGLFEVTGPAGKLSTNFPLGYGFTAIIVAFLGRLHPIGILLAGLLMALTYIGGELAQFQMSIPAAAIQVFQGMLLFFLLGVDILVNFRLRWDSKSKEAH